MVRGFIPGGWVSEWVRAAGAVRAGNCENLEGECALDAIAGASLRKAIGSEALGQKESRNSRELGCLGTGSCPSTGRMLLTATEDAASLSARVAVSRGHCFLRLEGLPSECPWRDFPLNVRGDLRWTAQPFTPAVPRGSSEALGTRLMPIPPANHVTSGFHRGTWNTHRLTNLDNYMHSHMLFQLRMKGVVFFPIYLHTNVSKIWYNKHLLGMHCKRNFCVTSALNRKYRILQIMCDVFTLFRIPLKTPKMSFFLS